ncbi:MAG TPA: hypothetical protein VL357_09225 [Rariglobus sp.]|jgi:hypothetical protein|nr:hypothetical protein [Rariglobus sp.]
MEEPLTPGHPPWWQWLTVLSLDAPLVAVLWQDLFARILGVSLGWHQYALLGLTVWIVYVADRWIEGWLLSADNVHTQRHSFYIRWRWPVFGLGVAAAAFCAFIVFTRLGPREWMAGVVLIIPVLIYLLSHQLVHRHNPWRVPKEICIAVIFCLGTTLAPVVIALPADLRDVHVVNGLLLGRLEPLWVPLGLFGLLCLANLALISAWETEVDEKHGQTSIALQFSGSLRLIRGLPWVLTLLGFLAAFGTHNLDRIAGLCVAGSGLLLGGLDRLEPKIGRESARTLVDLALLTPAVALLFL